MNSNDDSAALIERVGFAIEKGQCLSIQGGDSKAGLGNQPEAQDDVGVLSTLQHQGIISYEPTELVVTVRSGTPLTELQNALDDAGQLLPFEPPAFPGSTIGGVLACGLSGPSRPFTGAARDYVLGTRVINGQGQDLSFGGQVMKNVAGYDVSRLQIGAWGTLGVLLDVSMKVLPKPEMNLTLQFDDAAGEANSFSALLRQSLPLSGAMLIGKQRYLRLSGSATAVQAAARQLGGEQLADGDALWSSVRNHTHGFFDGFSRQVVEGKSLWRISVAGHTGNLDLHGEWLHEWAGAQRWLITGQKADDVFRVVAAAGGHASKYSVTPVGESAFQSLQGPMMKLQARVRDSLDPARIFNPGRFHPELDES